MGGGRFTAPRSSKVGEKRNRNGKWGREGVEGREARVGPLHLTDFGRGGGEDGEMRVFVCLSH